MASTAATNANRAPMSGLTTPNWSTMLPPSLPSLNSVAAVSVAKPRRKLNSTAAGMATPTSRAPRMVASERLVPGHRATHWARPMISAWR